MNTYVRIQYKILLLTYKSLTLNQPAYINQLLPKYVPGRSLRSSDLNLICIPRTNTKTFGHRSFSFAAATLWNALPLHIKKSTSIALFKKSLKTHLFEQ